MPHNKPKLIAIDGPAGAGKTIAGGLLAQKLGYRFLDTGMMYRAATVAVIDANAPIDDQAAITCVAEKLRFDVEEQEDGKESILINGQDVTSRLLDREIDRNVSSVSAIPRIREIMVREQRRIAREGRMVMIGRDIGTVVLPDAELKVFLTATPETRAQRRYRDFTLRAIKVAYSEVLAEIRRRDELDSSRQASPLRPADDAEVINTDDMTLEQVVDHLKALACGTS